MNKKVTKQGILEGKAFQVKSRWNTEGYLPNDYRFVPNPDKEYGGRIDYRHNFTDPNVKTYFNYEANVDKITDKKIKLFTTIMGKCVYQTFWFEALEWSNKPIHELEVEI